MLPILPVHIIGIKRFSSFLRERGVIYIGNGSFRSCFLRRKSHTRRHRDAHARKLYNDDDESSYI